MKNPKSLSSLGCVHVGSRTASLSGKPGNDTQRRPDLNDVNMAQHILRKAKVDDFNLRSPAAASVWFNDPAGSFGCQTCKENASIDAIPAVEVAPSEMERARDSPSLPFQQASNPGNLQRPFSLPTPTCS